MDEDEVIEQPDEPKPRGPNWQAIVGSTVWKRQIKPWLAALYQGALEDMAPPGPPGTPSATLANLESYHYHRGRVDMLREVLLTPDAEQALVQTTREMETQDAQKQQRVATDYRRRRATL